MSRTRQIWLSSSIKKGSYQQSLGTKAACIIICLILYLECEAIQCIYLFKKILLQLKLAIIGTNCSQKGLQTMWAFDIMPYSLDRLYKKKFFEHERVLFKSENANRSGIVS